MKKVIAILISVILLSCSNNVKTGSFMRDDINGYYVIGLEYMAEIPLTTINEYLKEIESKQDINSLMVYVKNSDLIIRVRD